MVKAIIFDAGDVIYYRDEETLKPILNFLKKNGYKVSARQFLEAYDKYILATYKGKISKDTHLKKMLQYLKIKSDNNFFNEFAKIFRQYFSNIKIKHNIFEIFEKLKSLGIKIAILTDTLTTEEKKWAWLKSINVAQFIDIVVCSSVTRRTKDEREAYIITLKKLNIHANEAIFVGHKNYEMKGAKLAGIKSVSLEIGTGADYYINDISEILKLIRVK